MKQLDARILKALSILAIIASSIPVTIMALWIKAANLGNTQAERVEIFYSYLPEFLHGRWITTSVSIVFCILAILLSGTCIKLLRGAWRIVNILVLAVTGALLLLNLFFMM